MRRKKQARKASMIPTTSAAGTPLMRDQSHDSSLSGVEMEKRGARAGTHEVRSGV